MNVKSASLSLQLKKLEKRNMIARKKVSGDDRLKEVCLTPAGNALKDKINEEVQLLEDTLTAGISESDLTIFGNVVWKMLENISLDGCSGRWNKQEEEKQ